MLVHTSTVTEDEVDVEATGSERWVPTGILPDGCRIQALRGTADYLHSTFETFEEGRESMCEPERVVEQLF